MTLRFRKIALSLRGIVRINIHLLQCLLPSHWVQKRTSADSTLPGTSFVWARECHLLQLTSIPSMIGHDARLLENTKQYIEVCYRRIHDAKKAVDPR